MEDGGGTLMASHRVVEWQVSLDVLEQVGDRGESWTEEEELDLKRCIGIAGYDREKKSVPC